MNQEADSISKIKPDATEDIRFLLKQVADYAVLRRMKNTATTAHLTEAPAKISGEAFFASAFAQAAFQ